MELSGGRCVGSARGVRVDVSRVICELSRQGDGVVRAPAHRPTLAADTPLMPTYDRYEFGTYYGSHVGTDRWWRLPSIEFHRGERRVPFYPSIMESEADDDALLVEASERIVRRTLAYLDGR